MAQFGINANPIVNKQWRNQTLMDDAVATSQHERNNYLCDFVQTVEQLSYSLI